METILSQTTRADVRKILTILEEGRWCKVGNVHLHDHEALSEEKEYWVKFLCSPNK
jgi:hypothetical protein